MDILVYVANDLKFEQTSSGSFQQTTVTKVKNSFIDNVYSSNESAYPTNRKLGDYWYDNRQ